MFGLKKQSTKNVSVVNKNHEWVSRLMKADGKIRVQDLTRIDTKFEVKH